MKSVLESIERDVPEIGEFLDARLQPALHMPYIMQAGVRSANKQKLPDGSEYGVVQTEVWCKRNE